MNGSAPAQRRVVEVDGGFLEVHEAEAPSGAPVVGAAHPTDRYVSGTAELLRRLSGARVVCINPRGLGGSSPGEPDSLEAMVADIDCVRARLGIERWAFWGISGGGWLAQLYGRNYPAALSGLILESCCASFCERVKDPACIMSPHHAQWSPILVRHGLLKLGLDGGASADEAEVSLDNETLAGEWCPVPEVGVVFSGPGQQARFVLPEGFPDSERMRRAQLAFLNFDSRPWLSTLRMPVLVLAGTADPVTPFAHSKVLHERLSRSSLVAVDGASHNPAIQGHEVAVQAVRSFLEVL